MFNIFVLFIFKLRSILILFLENIDTFLPSTILQHNSSMCTTVINHRSVRYHSFISLRQYDSVDWSYGSTRKFLFQFIKYILRAERGNKSVFIFLTNRPYFWARQVYNVYLFCSVHTHLLTTTKIWPV